ncbi:MAG: hypothetical protein SFY66_24400 [Oculatellaceae cyanobacterium bins.114]|nr:hypothetical protein [Oculatellaceae cyanobacterium bins.114]
MNSETQFNSNADDAQDHSAAVDTYDRGIVPAETAARKEREKDAYKRTPGELGQGGGPEDIDTTGGYTVDKEGLIDNFPIEPEMYINEPGDLREKEEAEKAAQIEERHAANNTDEEGNLTMDHDSRSKGVGLI